jgi:hypothetical protein
MSTRPVRPVRPVWRLPYTFPKQSLIETLNEIIAGTFRDNRDFQREILIQCRERGLCSFPQEDVNAWDASPQDITVIPQPQMERGKH